MKKQRLPRNWTQERLRKLASYHENLREEDQAAEIEAAFSSKDQTLMAVPTKLVPKIRALISRRRGA